MARRWNSRGSDLLDNPDAVFQQARAGGPFAGPRPTQCDQMVVPAASSWRCIGPSPAGPMADGAGPVRDHQPIPNGATPGHRCAGSSARTSPRRQRPAPRPGRRGQRDLPAIPRDRPGITLHRPGLGIRGRHICTGSPRLNSASSGTGSPGSPSHCMAQRATRPSGPSARCRVESWCRSDVG